MEVDEPSLVGRQPVVDQDLDPVAKVPEAEPEDAAVAVLKVLVGRDDAVEEPGRERQRGDGREEPGVALLALLDVEPSGALADELGPLADLLWKVLNEGSSN